jgi:hypothetical protein
MRESLLRYLVAAGLSAGLFTSCSDTRVSGPSTEQGNPQIVAVVLDSLGHPVENAIVTVYRSVPSYDSIQQPSEAVQAAFAGTDARGKCSFDSLVPGVYSLSASDSAHQGSAMKPGISLSVVSPSHPEAVDTLVLAAPGSLVGVVTRGGVPGTIGNRNLRDGFIQVKLGEIDRFTVTGVDGRYSFSALPGGTYSIYYYATDGFYTAKRQGVTVEPGIAVAVDTVKLTPVPRLIPPTGFHAEYDSGGGAVRLFWDRVVYENLRWYEVERIDLGGARDSVFTTVDTTIVDSLRFYNTGDTLDYVVRSVDSAFNRSQNAGPVEIIVR